MSDLRRADSDRAGDARVPRALEVTRSSIPLVTRIGAVAGRLRRLLESLPAAAESHADALAFLAAEEDAARADDVREAAQRLELALALDDIDVDILALAGLAEESEGFAALLRVLHPSGMPYATTGLAARLFAEDGLHRETLRRRLQAGSLASSGVVELSEDGVFFERSLYVCNELWSVLRGGDAWPAGTARSDTPAVLAGLDEWFALPDVVRASECIARGLPCTVAVTGESLAIAFHRARALVTSIGLEASAFAPTEAPEEATLRRVGLHCLARGSVPVWQIPRANVENSRRLPDFSRLPTPVVVAASSGTALESSNHPIVPLRVERLPVAACCAGWQAALPELAQESHELATRFPVEPDLAADVGRDVRLTVNGRAIPMERVADSIRARAGIGMGVGARLVRPEAEWEDLVLPASHLAGLREAVERVRHQPRVFDEWGFLERRRGARGCRLMLAGPPGCGKSLAGEVLARALSVDLLVVDLSRIVSKWIGETEKNLAEVFDAAELARAAILFDEADALFSQRTEVQDSRDRYANLETAYLLSRLETFDALAILCTNFRHNIDRAFLRRLEFVIDVEEPDLQCRLELWEKHVAPRAPLDDDVCLPELAERFPVTGGLIRNAAVAAAFLAASESRPLRQEHFLHALRREYEKAGRSFSSTPV